MKYGTIFAVRITETINNASTMDRLIMGDVRRYAVINTTEYNEDGIYAVQVSDYDGLDGLGFNEGETVTRVSDKTELFVSELNVGDIATTDFVGAYIMRIA